MLTATDLRTSKTAKIKKLYYYITAIVVRQCAAVKFLKLSNKQHMGPFYAPTCKTDCLEILCKFCKN